MLSFKSLQKKQIKDIVREYNLKHHIPFSRVVDGKRKPFTKKELCTELEKHLYIDEEDGNKIKKKNENFFIMPEKKMKAEHKKLINVLEKAEEKVKDKKVKEELKEEIKEQSKELKKVEKKDKKTETFKKELDKFIDDFSRKDAGKLAKLMNQFDIKFSELLKDEQLRKEQETEGKYNHMILMEIKKQILKKID
jgi:hypothetical protein